MEVETYLFLFFLLLRICFISYSLDNGVARTPPMGWLSWGTYECILDCDAGPEYCISERLFMDMADRFISDGYKDVGYEYINIDDCWMASNRDPNGILNADPERFPRGIKFLADYMHDRGLKLGIYQNMGPATCMGFPGLEDYITEDVLTFADWEVDMIKVDACFTDSDNLDTAYVSMGLSLNETERHILYSCSWPYYQILRSVEPDYKLIAKTCNMWRNHHDIVSSWKSIKNIIDFFGDNQEVLTMHIGPGNWADPDMLMIGSDGLDPGQSRVQMGIWSMIPAPLLISADLKKMKPEFKEILQNKKVIAINQDPLGLPGRRICRQKQIEVWRRPISPMYRKETSYALLFLNRARNNKTVEINFHELGLRSKDGYFVFRVFNDLDYGVIYANDTFSAVIPGMDIIMFNCKLVTS